MNNIPHDEVIDSAVYEIAELQISCAETIRINKMLIHELKLCRKSFLHHGLEGHAWIVDQVLIMAGEE